MECMCHHLSHTAIRGCKPGRPYGVYVSSLALLLSWRTPWPSPVWIPPLGQIPLGWTPDPPPPTWPDHMTFITREAYTLTSTSGLLFLWKCRLISLSASMALLPLWLKVLPICQVYLVRSTPEVVSFDAEKRPCLTFAFVDLIWQRRKWSRTLESAAVLNCLFCACCKKKTPTFSLLPPESHVPWT